MKLNPAKLKKKLRFSCYGKFKPILENILEETWADVVDDLKKEIYVDFNGKSIHVGFGEDCDYTADFDFSNLIDDYLTWCKPVDIYGEDEWASSAIKATIERLEKQIIKLRKSLPK